MLKASLAREITNVVKRIETDKHLITIMRSIAEESVDARGRGYVYCELPTTDEVEIKHVKAALIELGYDVRVSLDEECNMADIMIRW